MSYKLSKQDVCCLFEKLSEKYDIYAPKRVKNAGRFSETDIVQYDRISDLSEIVWDEKSTYPMKEVLSPIQQTLFYFTEDEYRASKGKTRPMLIFARPCDINAMKVQARIYAGNGGFVDMYYQRMHDLAKYILMPCNGGDDTCFCVSMGTNTTDLYSMAVKPVDDGMLVEVTDEDLAPYFEKAEAAEFAPEFVQENEIRAVIPEIPDKEVLNALKKHPMWKQFNGRCISCGACTIACSTCTCFTTRDVIYGDNPEVGERRRVSASCQIDTFAKVAGGGDYRTTAGDRMRYKMLHKFHDYKARFGESHMCVGCGRCTGRCPEFISITVTLRKMYDAVEEIKKELGR
ncbi:MAG: anaerobic sulfite reductase subunit AsrA [Firmicutes bacterium]|nr:anaerobic sulfite reductase subunit AsrA [Bacillota bacterium]